MHVAIRADGGPELGYGHLVRSGALADELVSHGHTVTVATATPQPADQQFPDEVAVAELPARGDPEPFTQWLDTATPDVVFTDAYPIDTPYQQAVRSRVPLAVLQDDARHAVCADLFVNGNLYAASLDYEFVGPEPEVCLGTEYVLLRPEIHRRLTGEPPWRDPPERAIVTMGASDVAGVTPTVVRAFDGLDLRVDAIVGPGFSEGQEQAVRAAGDEVSADVRIARDPDDLEDRMFQADLAVSTASSTTYELLALGTPIVSVPVAENQEPIAAALRERGAAIVLKRGAGKDLFRRAIDEYLFSSPLRRKRRNTGQGLVDGRGTKRVCAKILSLAGEN